MDRTARLLCFIILLTLLAVPGTSLAETAESKDPVTVSGDSVARLATAVETLARLLKSQAGEKTGEKELRKLDIAISYLNFRSRRIELLERDLSRAKADRDRVEEMIQLWQERQDLLLKELEKQSPEGKNDLERSLQELAARQKSLEQRQAKYNEEIIVQENRIFDLQNQLDEVESYVQQHLEL